MLTKLHANGALTRALRILETGYPDFLDPHMYVTYLFCHALAAAADHRRQLSE